MKSVFLLAYLLAHVPTIPGLWIGMDHELTDLWALINKFHDQFSLSLYIYCTCLTSYICFCCRICQAHLNKYTYDNYLMESFHRANSYHAVMFQIDFI